MRKEFSIIYYQCILHIQIPLLHKQWVKIKKGPFFAWLLRVTWLWYCRMYVEYCPGINWEFTTTSHWQSGKWRINLPCTYLWETRNYAICQEFYFLSKSIRKHEKRWWCWLAALLWFYWFNAVTVLHHFH